MLRLRPPKFVSILSNLSIESPSYPSHPSSHPSVSSSPSLPQRGDSLDPRFILVLQPRVVILVPSLHRIFLKSFFEIIHRSIVSTSTFSLVLKRGIVSAYPIHAFALDHPNSPKHFIRIILVVSTFHHRRQRYSFSGFNSRLKVNSTSFFFSNLVPRFVSSRYIDSSSRKSRFFLPILALLWNTGKNWLCNVGTPLLKRGIEG